MIPVDQTLFGYPTGNCMTACIASIFHLSIEDVPNWCAQYPEEGQEDLLWRAYAEWLWRRGWRAILLDNTTNKEPYQYDPADAPDVLQRWSWSISVDGWYDQCVMVGGKSPRGDWGHAVVGRLHHNRVDIVHDPHPDRSGLLTVEDAHLFIPLPNTECL